MSQQDAVQVAARQKLNIREREEALQIIGEILGIYGEDDPLIDMPMIAALAGVAPGTPAAWQQRTRSGRERVPFPPPDDSRYADKPQWRAISTIIERFLKPSERWPRGVAARETTRRPRNAVERIGLGGLRHKDAELAKALKARRLDDGQPRTVGGWRRRLNQAVAQNAEADAAGL